MPTINGRACVVNGSAVDKAFSNGRQVYGRNLLINTSNLSTNGQTSMQGSSAAIYGVYSRTDSYEQVTADPNYSQLFYRFMLPDINNLYGLIPGEAYTLSGISSYTAGKLNFISAYSINGKWYGSDVTDLEIPVSDGSVFTPFSHTFTIPVEAIGAYISLQNFNYTNGSLFRFKNMKLEKGTIATPWTPAPEDIM